MPPNICKQFGEPGHHLRPSDDADAMAGLKIQEFDLMMANLTSCDGQAFSIEIGLQNINQSQKKLRLKNRS